MEGTMIIATDVKYDDEEQTARAVAIAFEDWGAARAAHEFVAHVDNVAEYVPCEFFRRELPCLHAVLKLVDIPITAVIVDGHVWLGEKPGLGHYLWTSVGCKWPVVGVAKSRFHAGGALEVCRGESTRPLYVSSVGGIPDSLAAANVRGMHGPYRMPSMLKLVDKLTRA